MKTVSSVYEATVEVKRSKFLAVLLPYERFESAREALRDTHPKANHIVYAWRYLNAFGQIVEQSSDDGEPKGCAGLPALRVLRGAELINVGVLIVRYFGGIKLGTGGMARAYAQAVQAVIADAKLDDYYPQQSYRFSSGYGDIRRIEYMLKQVGIASYEREFGNETVEWIVSADEAHISALRGLMGD